MYKNRRYQLRLLRVSEAIDGISFTSPKTVASYMEEEARADREVFWVLHLNNKNRIVRKELTAMGAVDHCSIVPGIVLRAAVALGTAGIITVHNHPSGDPSPSTEDRHLWTTLREGCKLLGIRLVDNVVLGDQRYYSEEESK